MAFHLRNSDDRNASHVARTKKGFHDPRLSQSLMPQRKGSRSSHRAVTPRLGRSPVPSPAASIPHGRQVRCKARLAKLGREGGKRGSGGTVSCPSGRATHLEISNNALTGTIPTELGLLSELTHLDLSDSDLTGTIPTQLGAIVKA